ncbi:hypothetical protein KC19_8G192200 [Ceratodon purpureus]|uniref:Uncharacterized protein n=1 Tax=Ceratodon purpureus TaxID=3225 RepID=A0A8T0H2P9_CERPU|nr:hypothetical protein KC19_8G192200 [Ceratodon purpureus]
MESTNLSNVCLPALRPAALAISLAGRHSLAGAFLLTPALHRPSCLDRTGKLPQTLSSSSLSQLCHVHPRMVRLSAGPPLRPFLLPLPRKQTSLLRVLPAHRNNLHSFSWPASEVV